MKSIICAAIIVALAVSLFAVAIEARTFPQYARVGIIARNATGQRGFVDCVKACNTAFSKETAACVSLGSQFRGATSTRVGSTTGRCKSDAAQKLRVCKRQCSPR